MLDLYDIGHDQNMEERKHCLHIFLLVNSLVIFYRQVCIDCFGKFLHRIQHQMNNLSILEHIHP